MFDFWTSNTFFGTQRLKAHNYAKNFWVVIAPQGPSWLRLCTEGGFEGRSET